MDRNTPVLSHKKDASMEDTVLAMKKLARAATSDLTIRGVVEKICAGLAEGDYTGEVIAINNYVKQRVRYMRDPDGVELLKTPARTLSTGSGDCDDIATLLAAMLMCAGNTVNFVIAAFEVHGNRPIFSHVFVEVVTPFGPITLDPVANRITRSMISSIKKKMVIPVGETPGAMDAGIRGLQGLGRIGAWDGRDVFAEGSSTSLGRSLGQAPHVSTTGNNIYSVFDHERNVYEYFEGTRKQMPATGRFRKPRVSDPIGIAPEEIAESLPMMSRKIGEGDEPRGVIASKSSSMLSGVSTSGLGKFALFFTCGAVVGWSLRKRKRASRGA